jgi:hypothetical protein
MRRHAALRLWRPKDQFCAQSYTQNTIALNLEFCDSTLRWTTPPPSEPAADPPFAQRRAPARWTGFTCRFCSCRGERLRVPSIPAGHGVLRSLVNHGGDRIAPFLCLSVPARFILPMSRWAWSIGRFGSQFDAPPCVRPSVRRSPSGRFPLGMGCFGQIRRRGGRRQRTECTAARAARAAFPPRSSVGGRRSSPAGHGLHCSELRECGRTVRRGIAALDRGTATGPAGPKKVRGRTKRVLTS